MATGSNGLCSALLGACFAALLGSGCGRESQPDTPTGIRAERVPLGVALEDPTAASWREVPETRISMLPQMAVSPSHPQPSVTELRVRAAHDGDRLAVRITWEDATEDVVLHSDRFGDQVAIQFPLRPDAEPTPSPMMGHIGAPVRILQWRAVLQRELAHGTATIRELYPNAVVDLYPDRLLSGEVVGLYMGGRALGNPVSRPRLLSPVVTHVAEGWGTLTAAAEQPASGAGVWSRGSWTVVILYPLSPRADVPGGLRPGLETIVAFAVWDGGNREVGARKAWSTWVPLSIAP
jgi:DMSO reductase family type II enzyme heme b subunit